MAQPRCYVTVRLTVEENEKLEEAKHKGFSTRDIFLKGLEEVLVDK